MPSSNVLSNMMESVKACVVSARFFWSLNISSPESGTTLARPPGTASRFIGKRGRSPDNGVFPLCVLTFRPPRNGKISLFKEILRCRLGGMARSDGLAAARDFLFQARDARFQFVRGKRADVFPQHNIRQLLSR